MYHTAYRPRRKSGVFVPFLMLVTIALAGVLVFQIWSYFHARALQKTENKAAITIVSGRAEMLVWGQKQWVLAATGGFLREGDSIHVFPDSRVSLALLNGGFIRLNGDTEVNITSLKTKDREDVVALHMTRGEAWLKKARSDAVKTSFSVSTADMEIRTIGTIFDVFKRDETRIRVMEGGIAIDIKNEENGKVRVIDTVEVGIGQEAVISDASMDAFRARKDPDVIFAVFDSFREGEWYAWNTQEDISASSVSVLDAVKNAGDSEADKTDIQASAGLVTGEDVPLNVASGPIPSPVIIEPDALSRKTTQSKILVRGTTGERTRKIAVSTFAGGKKDTYNLQKYTPGSIEWTYFASSEFGNYFPGENRYEITAIDENGQKSAPLELVLIYDKEKPKADLSALVVLKFNSQDVPAGNRYETCDDPVLIEGSVGKGIVKIFVDDFQLTQYVAGNEKWYYKAKESFGNLKTGENSYIVYGMDVDGTSTPKTTFYISKCVSEKKPATEVESAESDSPTQTQEPQTVIDVEATPAE